MKRETFDLAPRWFDVMTAVFHVVEDRPPHDRLWSDTLPDERDRQIWTAAVRSQADMVVTDNLRDAPPPGRNGLRIWDGILFVHPDLCLAFLDWLTRPRETIDNVAALEERSPGPPAVSDDDRGLHPRLLAFLRTMGRIPPDGPSTSDAEG